MRILMLLTKPTLQDGRVLREARALIAAGHKVSVLQWDRHEPDAPRHETHEGIDIHRIAARGPQPLATLRWWNRAKKWAKDHAFEVVHAHDLDTLPIATATGRPVVYDAHEAFHLMVADRGRVVSDMARRLERRHLPKVTRSITVNEAVAAYLQPPVHIVMNCPDLPPTKGPKGPFTVMYAGVLERARFFPDAVKALGGMPGVRFVVAGKQESGFAATKQEAEAHDNVRFLGTIAQAEVMAYTQQAHAVLCMFDPKSPIHRIGSPNKLFEAMAAGRPVIATRGTWSGDFVARHGIGIATGFDAASLRYAVGWLRDHPRDATAMGLRGRSLAERTYNWPAQAKELVSCYEALL